MAEVKASLRLTLVTGGIPEVTAATRAVKALAAAANGAASAEGRQASAGAAAVSAGARTRVTAMRTVESEMARLTALEEKRAITAQARSRLGMGSSFLTGHGFADKTRQIVGGIRDLTVAGMGVRFAFGAAENAISSVMDPAREFGATMAEVRNKGSFSAAQTAEIANMAKAMGRNSIFSPQEAGKAAVELAAAGMQGPDIQSAMPSTLRFAQAGGLGTEASTAVLVETMSQFGLKAKDFEHIGDTLVKAANMSTVSVADMAESLKYAGPIARAAGISLEFTAGTIALLGENGLKGSMGGTALRKMIDSLAHASKTAKPALAALGMTPDDLKKGMQDLPAFFEKLSSRMSAKQMDKAHQLEISKLLFGEEGMAASQILMTKALDHGANGWRAYAEQVGNASGAMQTAADIAGDTLDGRIKKLDASLTTAKLTLGEAFVPALSALTPEMTAAANAAGAWAQKNQELIPQLLEGGGALALLGLGTKGAAGLGALAQTLAPAATLAGASFSSAFGAAFIAGIAAWGITTAILEATKNKTTGSNLANDVGRWFFDMQNGTGVERSDDRGLKAGPVFPKGNKVEDAIEKEKRYSPEAAFNAVTGQIEIKVTDERVRVLSRSSGPVSLRTGTNAGARQAEAVNPYIGI